VSGGRRVGAAGLPGGTALIGDGCMWTSRDGTSTGTGAGAGGGGAAAGAGAGAEAGLADRGAGGGGDVRRGGGWLACAPPPAKSSTPIVTAEQPPHAALHAPYAVPTPTWVKAGLRMLARWPGLFMKLVLRYWAIAPAPARPETNEMFSPAGLGAMPFACIMLKTVCEPQIGRASCRERVEVRVGVVAVLKHELRCRHV